MLQLGVLLVAAIAIDAVPALSVNEKHVQTIESYLNTTANPCENFYMYACGNWPLQHNSTHYAETTGLIDLKVNKRLIDLFESYTPTKEAHNVYNKVWTYYKSCKREKQHNSLRYLQLVRPAEHANWPILRKSKSNSTGQFNWMLTLAKLRRYGIKGTLIDHMVLQDSENKTKYIIDLDEPELRGNSKLPTPFVCRVLLWRLGVQNKTKLFKLAEELIKFESEIEKLLEIEDEYGLLEMSLQELRDDMPQLPWRKYLSTVLNQSISDDYTIQIRNWEYLERLQQLIENTDTELVCYYIMLKFVYYLTVDSASKYSKVDCMVDVRSKMELALNYIYYEHFYKSKALEYNAEVVRLLDLMKSQLEHKLSENRLNLHEYELEFLREKVRQVRLNIGNLPANISLEFVEHYYRDIVLSPKNYYKNQLTLLELRTRMEHARLAQSPPAIEQYFYISDSDTARSSTPYYLMRENLITVPFGILQPPMFHKNLHDVLKVSLFGFLLAHELAHGFDTSGVVFDYVGNAQDLGSNITETARFNETIQCLQRNETENIDERIADVVGVRLAYDALFSAHSQLQVKQPHFTQIPLKRLFFLNLAQFFCGNFLFEFMDHDSDNVRLQQILLHFEPFAEEFQCDLGDTLHPEEKCRLW